VPAPSWRARVLVAAVAIGSLILAPSALASDPSPTTVAEATRQFDALYADAERARARLQATSAEAASLAARLEVAQASAQRQENRVITMTAELGGFAAAMYRAPISDPTIELLVSDDPARVLAQTTRLDVVADQRVDALAVVAAARAELQQTSDDIAEQQARLDALQQQMRAEQRELDRAAQRAKAVVDELAEQERQRLAELQQRIRAEADARSSRGADRTSPATTVSGGAPPGGGGCVVSDPTGTGGCVTPATAWVVQQMRATFGALPMACWRGGGGDHAQGRACDMMMAPGGTYANAEQKDRGWRLAEWLRANASRLQVDYVIWQGRIWSVQRAGEGWRPYNGYGATGGHYDHVHVSVRA
jgi:hypothetical protein